MAGVAATRTPASALGRQQHNPIPPDRHFTFASSIHRRIPTAISRAWNAVAHARHQLYALSLTGFLSANLVAAAFINVPPSSRPLPPPPPELLPVIPRRVRSDKMPSHPAAPTRPRERPRPPNPVVVQNEQQWIFTEEDLLHTPSIEDGMSPEQEKEMRYKGMTFIYQVGAMLKLPQLTLSTAGVFLNRFITRRSLVSKDGYKALHHYVRLPCSLTPTRLTDPSKSQQRPCSSRPRWKRTAAR